MLNTVKKVGPVLELFTPERSEWRMTEIAQALEMPKSSAHSLLSTMADIGLLSTTNQGRYRLGWMLLTLGDRMRVTVDFRSRVQPLMEELAGRLRETVLLAVLDRDQVLYVERAEGTHPTVRLAGVRVGARLPVHCTAVGKVLLADRDPSEVRAIISRAGMKPFTKRSHSTVEDLENDLAHVRSRGAAFDLGEVSPDVFCIAVPVRDHYRSVVAAMSVSVPAYRFDPSREAVLDALSDTGERASAALASSPAAERDTAGAVSRG